MAIFPGEQRESVAKYIRMVPVRRAMNFGRPHCRRRPTAAPSYEPSSTHDMRSHHDWLREPCQCVADALCRHLAQNTHTRTIL